MASNYNSAIYQMTAYGLLIDHIEFGRVVRTKVAGDREKRGWYVLHEVTRPNGDVLIFGSYGIFRGSDNGKQNITYDKSQFSQEEITAFKKRAADDAAKAEAIRKSQAEKSARRAESVWNKLLTEGHSCYLDRKQIKPFGIRFTESGSIAIALRDDDNRIRGIQFILDKEKQKDKIEKNGGKDKIFWPPGLTKKATFNIIGGAIGSIALLAEGYATAATLHMATELPVVICWDANNIDSVIEKLKKKHRATKFLICADDDRFSTCIECQYKINLASDPENCPHCQKPHKKLNTGIRLADVNVIKHTVEKIIPKFLDENARLQHFLSGKGKLSDFNDVHLIDGLYSVSDQIKNRINELGWRVNESSRNGQQMGGGDGEKSIFKPFDTVDELLERFSLVYGRGGTLFDHHEHMLVTLSDMRDACMSRDIHRRWQESPHRSIVRAENVGFDPAGNDKQITCNLWAGWPTQPKDGKCDSLLELLEYMCGSEGHQKSKELYQWVLKWLAFPIQNPGAKMKTTIVIHGPQGTGKNLFFDTVSEIYGRYGRTIDQTAIEDKFNDWASGKLFLIADEVVARSDLYHVKNKLKHFITGDTIRINPKNMAAYEEKNHVNLVFLSNERLPVVLEDDDRRHVVIWTPEKLSESFYKEVFQEITAGGCQALHHYLLNVNLDGFNEHAKPPMTQAKSELIELSKDSVIRFYQEWENGDIDGVRLIPVLSEDIYELYKVWCSRQGLRTAPLNKMIDSIIKRKGARKERKRYMSGSHVGHPKTFIFPKNCLEMSPGNSEQGWLGQCIDQFRQQILDYKGINYG